MVSLWEISSLSFWYFFKFTKMHFPYFISKMWWIFLKFLPSKFWNHPQTQIFNYLEWQFGASKRCKFCSLLCQRFQTGSHRHPQCPWGARGRKGRLGRWDPGSLDVTPIGCPPEVFWKRSCHKIVKTQWYNSYH